MLASRLTHLLRNRRDNDVVVGPSMKHITGVEYHALSDQIVIEHEGDTWQNDVLVLLTELDRGLRNHDVGNSLWYEDWRKRAAAAIGVDEEELNSRSR